MNIIPENVLYAGAEYSSPNTIPRPPHCEVKLLIQAPIVSINLDNCLEEIFSYYLEERYEITKEELLDAFPEKQI